MDISTTDYLRHTAEMVVVETLWQLHTLTVINSWLNIMHVSHLLSSWSL